MPGAIPFKGPIAKAEIAPLSEGFADPDLVTSVTVDDIMEEALEFPKEAEATANLADGTPEQASVAVPFALPVLDTATAFNAAMTASSRGRERVLVRITTADGAQKIYGGGIGFRVRSIKDDNLAPDAFPVTVWMFHAVFGHSGQGIGPVTQAA